MAPHPATHPPSQPPTHSAAPTPSHGAATHLEPGAGGASVDLLLMLQHVGGLGAGTEEGCGGAPGGAQTRPSAGQVQRRLSPLRPVGNSRPSSRPSAACCWAACPACPRATGGPSRERQAAGSRGGTGPGRPHLVGLHLRLPQRPLLPLLLDDRRHLARGEWGPYERAGGQHPSWEAPS